MKIKLFYFLILFLIILIKDIHIISGLVSCNIYIDSTSSNNTSPCGLDIISPCQSIDSAVLTCPTNYDEINLNFIISNSSSNSYIFNNTSPFSEIGNNKIINFINLNQSISTVVLDMSSLSTSFISITNNYSNNNYFTSIGISGFTFINFDNSGVGRIFGFVNTFINLTIDNCHFKDTKNKALLPEIVYYSNFNNNNNPNNNFIIVNNSIFSNLESSIVGYSLFNLINVNLIIQDTVFENITTYYSDGFIVSLSLATSMKFINSKIINSVSTGGQFTNIKIDLSSQTLETSYAIPQPSFVFDNVQFNNSMNGNGIAMQVAKYYNILINQFTSINGFNFTPIYIFNSATFGGYNSSGSFGLNNQVVVSNSIFQNNTNTFNYAPYDYSSDASGGLSLTNVNATISNSIFTSNTAINGAALHISKYIPLPISKNNYIPYNSTIYNCTFNDNNSIKLAGSIFMDTIQFISITNSTFNNNKVNSLNGGNEIYCSNSTVLINDSILPISNSTSNQNEITCPSPNSCKLKSNNLNVKDICSDSSSISSSSSSSSSSHHKTSLTSGQKAGIAIGVILIVGIAVLIVILITKKSSNIGENMSLVNNTNHD